MRVYGLMVGVHIACKAVNRTAAIKNEKRVHDLQCKQCDDEADVRNDGQPEIYGIDTRKVPFEEGESEESEPDSEYNKTALYFKSQCRCSMRRGEGG